MDGLKQLGWQLLGNGRQKEGAEKERNGGGLTEGSRCGSLVRWLESVKRQRASTEGWEQTPKQLLGCESRGCGGRLLLLEALLCEIFLCAFSIGPHRAAHAPAHARAMHSACALQT